MNGFFYVFSESFVTELDVNAQLVGAVFRIAGDLAGTSGCIQREAIRPVAVFDADRGFLLAEEGFRPEGEHDGRRHRRRMVQNVVLLRLPDGSMDRFSFLNVSVIQATG